MRLRLFLCTLIALVLPPLAIACTHGRSRALVLNLVICAAGLGIFFFLFALPGVAIWCLGILHALLVTLFGRRAL